MEESAPSSPRTAARLVRDAAGYGMLFLVKHGWRMLLWFFCLLLPLWAFASLVGEVHEKAAFPFDAPILNVLHGWATPRLDRFFILITRLGYTWGVVPFDIATLLFLLVRRRIRDALFFGIAVTGSAVLNVVAKNHYARLRPDLWISLRPETTYSFPSGHAMASATLAVALIVLAWPSRWRWVVLAASPVFVLLVGFSRVYLGVHYPSDILAGWAAAIAWTFGMYLLVDQKAPPPPATAAPRRDTVGPQAPVE